MQDRTHYVKSVEMVENGVFIEVNETFMFACVYLTKAEQEDPEMKRKLEPLKKKYNEMKYKFVVMHSGTGDLLEATKALIHHNKKLSSPC